jgi:hypothetical protein
VNAPGLAVLLAVAAAHLTGQTFNLPPRAADAQGGDVFAASVSLLGREEREDRILREVLAGNVPAFLRQLVPVTTRVTIGGRERVARWFVTPDYLAIGSDDDYFLMPMTPLLAQRIADATGCLLPSKKMVDELYRSAPVKLAPRPIPPSGAMITVPVFKQHNDTLRVQRAAAIAQWPLGALVGGHKKDVIISNAIVANLKPSVPRPVVIYGWHQLNGVPIQPVYNGHGETYADYSHGIRLVQRLAILDTVPATIETLLNDPALWPLFSDEGRIVKPRYGDIPVQVPSKSSGSGQPPGIQLFQNFPNPFNPSTSIGFALGERGEVSVTVYDLLGRDVRTLVRGVLEAGEHRVELQADGLATGVYLCRLRSGSTVAVRRMMMLR